MRVIAGLASLAVAVNAFEPPYTDPQEWPNNDNNRQVPIAVTEGGFTGSNPCVQEWTYKRGNINEAKKGCIAIDRRIFPFTDGTEEDPATIGKTHFCFTGDANDNGAVVYNPTNVDKQKEWSYCDVSDTDNVRYQSPDGTPCAYQWNINFGDGHDPEAVLDSCIPFKDYKPLVTAETVPEGEENVPEDAMWCYIGPDKGYNPNKENPDGSPHEKAFDWKFCVDTLASPSTGTNGPTSAPTTAPTGAPVVGPEVTDAPTTPGPTDSPTTPVPSGAPTTPIPSASPTVQPSSAPTVSKAPTTASPTTDDDDDDSTNTAAIVVPIVVVALLAGAAGFFFWRKKQSQAPPPADGGADESFVKAEEGATGEPNSPNVGSTSVGKV